MPIKVPNHLPAKEALKRENIFVMDEDRAFHQDIRPLNIAILNLMPIKQTTEVQLLRLIGNSPLQINIKLVHMESHTSKNTSADYLESFYYTFSQIKDEKFDGMIITGAPIEQMPFEEVSYWKELCEVFEWTKQNVTSTLHICWGAQAGLYYHYGVPKYMLKEKMFGIFKHSLNKEICNTKLVRGFDSSFFAPHSRHTTILRDDIESKEGIEIISESCEAGVYIVCSKDTRQIFVTGHSEYDDDTLANEYFRDINKGLTIDTPKNYFKDNNPENEPLVTWKSHANILFANWLNYYVYQVTPYTWE